MHGGQKWLTSAWWAQQGSGRPGLVASRTQRAIQGHIDVQKQQLHGCMTNRMHACSCASAAGAAPYSAAVPTMPRAGHRCIVSPRPHKAARQAARQPVLTLCPKAGPALPACGGARPARRPSPAGHHCRHYRCMGCLVEGSLVRPLAAPGVAALLLPWQRAPHPHPGQDLSLDPLRAGCCHHHPMPRTAHQLCLSCRCCHCPEGLPSRVGRGDPTPTAGDPPVPVCLIARGLPPGAALYHFHCNVATREDL